MGKENILISSIIGVRPIADRVTIEEATEIWKAAPIEDRLEAYGIICNDLCSNLAHILKMDKNNIQVLFKAAKSTPAEKYYPNIPPDVGYYDDGKISMRMVAGKRLKDRSDH